MKNDIWIYMEAGADGGLPVGAELIVPAKKLAGYYGGKTVAVIVGEGAKAAAEDAIFCGVDEALVIERPRKAVCNIEADANALYKLAQKYGPEVILAAATETGRDLMPRVAAKLETGLTSDCIDIGIDEEMRSVAFICPAFSGNLLAKIICEKRRPQMGTVRPGVFKKPERDEGRTGGIICEDVPHDMTAVAVKIVETIDNPEKSGLQIEDAETVVAGGRGMRSAKNFELLIELAGLLGGAVGATRPVADDGWMAQEAMIGQTGKTVRPALYIACGISGAAQHLAGIPETSVVIAINNDENAPIFNRADYGIVGDAAEILQRLIRKIKRYKND